MVELTPAVSEVSVASLSVVVAEADVAVAASEVDEAAAAAALSEDWIDEYRAAWLEY